MPDLKPDHLIIRYLSHEATAAEQEQLFDWVSRNNENHKIFNEYVAAWSKQTGDQPVFDTQNALWKLNDKINAHETVEKKKTVFWNRWNIAAAIAFMITAGVILYNTGRNAYEQHTESQLTEFITTDKRDTITLSDGSFITLNENSILKYSKDFSGNTREAYLIGEAFFKVAKNSSKPFIIHTENITTQVVGTSFNINTTNNSIVVSVATGSVKVSDGFATELLKPYEKVAYSKNTFSKESTDLSELIWTDRSLKFDDTPLEEVVKKLQKHYEVKIILKDEALKKCALTGRFTNEPLNVVLQAMEYSLGISAKKENNTITLSGKGCQ